MRMATWTANSRWLRHYLLTRGRTHRYGPHPSQVADLYLPAGPGPHPLVVLIHGGSWRQRFGRQVMREIAAELVHGGRAVWNIEYRRVEGGGGWPHTFDDVAAAIDHLDGLHAALDLDRVDLIGHSAGGHLALWAAGRDRLPPGAPGAIAGRPRVPVARVVSLAGVCDLAGAYRLWHGGAVRALMGGSPEALPERFEAADPLRRIPLAMPVLLVHGVLDETVSIRLSRTYAQSARERGAPVELVETEGEAGRHRAFIHPRGAGWVPVLSWLAQRPPRPAQASAPAHPSAPAITPPLAGADADAAV